MRGRPTLPDTLQSYLLVQTQYNYLQYLLTLQHYQATMAPNIKDQLPILKQIIQYFKKDGLVVDSPLMKVHNQMSCMVIGIGFIFISVENYLDTKAILCHSGQQFHAYAK